MDIQVPISLQGSKPFQSQNSTSIYDVYSFNYGVADPLTGDIKMQEETFINGVIRGGFWLKEPDGSLRQVTYTADDKNKFRAKVEQKIEHTYF